MRVIHVIVDMKYCTNMKIVTFFLSTLLSHFFFPCVYWNSTARDEIPSLDVPPHLLFNGEEVDIRGPSQ